MLVLGVESEDILLVSGPIGSGKSVDRNLPPVQLGFLKLQFWGRRVVVIHEHVLRRGLAIEAKSSAIAVVVRPWR